MTKRPTAAIAAASRARSARVPYQQRVDRLRDERRAGEVDDDLQADRRGAETAERRTASPTGPTNRRGAGEQAGDVEDDRGPSAGVRDLATASSSGMHAEVQDALLEVDSAPTELEPRRVGPTAGEQDRVRAPPRAAPSCRSRHFPPTREQQGYCRAMTAPAASHGRQAERPRRCPGPAPSRTEEDDASGATMHAKVAHRAWPRRRRPSRAARVAASTSRPSGRRHRRSACTARGAASSQFRHPPGRQERATPPNAARTRSAQRAQHERLRGLPAGRASRRSTQRVQTTEDVGRGARRGAARPRPAPGGLLRRRPAAVAAGDAGADPGAGLDQAGGRVAESNV